MLKHGLKSWKVTIYFLGDLDHPSLGRIACQKLGVVAKVDEIASPGTTAGNTKRTHPKVFTVLGCMPGEYEINLCEGVTLFNLTTPRRIPLPLLSKLQAQ